MKFSAKPIKLATCLVGSLHIAHNSYVAANDAAHAATYWAAEKMGYIPEQVTTEPMLKAYATQEAIHAGISPVLYISLIETESGFRNVDSGKGAIGPAQIMKPTGKSICGLTENELRNTQKNIACGATILAHELKTWKGDTIQALISYNAGSGKVDNPPSESIQYVRTVLNKVAKNTLD